MYITIPCCFFWIIITNIIKETYDYSLLDKVISHASHCNNVNSKITFLFNIRVSVCLQVCTPVHVQFAIAHTNSAMWNKNMFNKI